MEIFHFYCSHSQRNRSELGSGSHKLWGRIRVGVTADESKQAGREAANSTETESSLTLGGKKLHTNWHLQERQEQQEKRTVARKKALFWPRAVIKTGDLVRGTITQSRRTRSVRAEDGKQATIRRNGNTFFPKAEKTGRVRGGRTRGQLANTKSKRDNMKGGIESKLCILEKPRRQKARKRSQSNQKSGSPAFLQQGLSWSFAIIIVIWECETKGDKIIKTRLSAGAGDSHVHGGLITHGTTGQQDARSQNAPLHSCGPNDRR